MQASQSIRLILAAVVAIAVAVVLIAVLLATDTVLSIWERLGAVAPWAVGLYVALLVAVAAFTGWLVLKLFFFRGGREDREPPPDAETLRTRLEESERQGVAVGAAREELGELERRQAAGTLYLALFGEVSTGKSALINALVPGARQRSDPRAGTTRDIASFEWSPRGGLPVRVVDVPGFGDVGGDALAEAARQEALRAHVVVYVCDGDLGRGQHAELARLAQFDKPLVVALNKADRYRAEELALIEKRIRETVATPGQVEVVRVSAGGREEIVVVDADGRERIESRERPPDTGALVAAVSRLIDADREGLEERYTQSVLAFAHARLREAQQRHRARAAEALVDRYARRAVLGALAAVTPGSDLVIQGALATKLISDLCALYDVPLKRIDLDRFLELAGGRVRRTTAIVLAVAGNALKAFPGVGTLVGGLAHAVAYGMIFDSLGRAVAQALAEGSSLLEPDLAERFEDQLRRGMGARSRHFAKIALEQLQEQERRERD